jgi:CDP-glucose 4,6-dehydratase
VPKSNLNWSGFNDKVISIRGEVEDYFILERTLNEYEVDSVFHLAVHAIVGTANKNPISNFESNIKGTWNILEACRRAPKVERIVMASSNKAKHGAQEKFAL